MVFRIPHVRMHIHYFIDKVQNNLLGLPVVYWKQQWQWTFLWYGVGQIYISEFPKAVQKVEYGKYKRVYLYQYMSSVLAPSPPPSGDE